MVWDAHLKFITAESGTALRCWGVSVMLSKGLRSTYSEPWKVFPCEPILENDTDTCNKI